MTRAVRVAVPFLFVLFIFSAGCDYFAAAPTGRVVIRLTDAPLDVQEVNVTIEKITLLDTQSGDRENLLLGSTTQRVNLLDYQGGHTLKMVDQEVHIDRFDQFRLAVGEDADIVVSGERYDLHVASGARSGIKFMLEDPIEMTGGLFDLTLDFDAAASVVVLGPMSKPKGYLLKPVIRPFSASLNDSLVDFSFVPEIANPGDQYGRAGDMVTLQLVASDADNDPLTFAAEGLPPSLEIDSETGIISGMLSQEGSFEVTVSVTDDDGSSAAVFTWTVAPPPRVGSMESVFLQSVSSSAWQSASLLNTYSTPVIVCSMEGSSSTVPSVVRMRNVSESGFEVLLEDPSKRFVPPEDVYCLVAEEGAWTLPDGRSFEARRYLSTVTDWKNSWVGERQSYGTAFDSPVVVGQVMSYNDGNWSVFWSRGTTTDEPPNSGELWVGKHVGDDVRVARLPEEVGYFVVESGSGFVEGIAYEAGVGADIVQGIFQGAPFSYAFSVPFANAPEVGVVSIAGMDGPDGAWPVLFGASPFTGGWLDLAVHEDQRSDFERDHTTEQVSYLVFERA
ncbi:MAG: DUF4382 domain-containing protein, partial [Rhodothermales bacterium]|nr:DUF4382 domain-containing protein [Rhodothermales bacterium]